MTVEEARSAVVAELRDQGLIARTEDYTHEVPFSQRSGERIEPLISLQWFMRMDELVKPAIEVVESGRSGSGPRATPACTSNWMENIRPWCISRQLWWGHRIPVWYRGEELYVGSRAARGRGLGARPRRARHVVQLRAVPVRGARLARGHPGAPRVLPDRRAGHRPGHHLPLGRADDHAGDRVHRRRSRSTDVYIHSIIQAPDGRRMSKSLGTGVDPIDLINGGPRPPVFAGRRRLPGLRRRRGALGPVRDVLGAGRPLQRGEARPGSPADEQALERRPADPARRRSDAGRRRARRRSRTAGSSPGWSARGRDRRADRPLRLRACRARAVRLRLRRAVRLVSRAGQAAPARRRAPSCRPRCCTC